MSVLKNLLEKLKRKKELSSGYADEQRTIETYHNKKLSANEREVIRFREEARQKRIKQELERHRKIQSNKTWSGKEGNPVYAKNIIANHKKLFSAKGRLT